MNFIHRRQQRERGDLYNSHLSPVKQRKQLSYYFLKKPRNKRLLPATVHYLGIAAQRHPQQ